MINIPKENILDAEKLLTDPVDYIEELDRENKLAEVFPSVATTKGVKQSEIRHKEGDVFTHTLLALRRVKKETPSDKEFGPIEDKHELLLIILALLYHDTGKKERNLHDKPENRVFHDAESIKHARGELAQYLSEEDLETVIELIKKHETILSENISYRLNKLHQLFCLGGNLQRGRLLLKFSECDIFGREIAEGYDHVADKTNLIVRRNIALYKLLLEQGEQGAKSPAVQRTSGEITNRIKTLLATVPKISIPK